MGLYRVALISGLLLAIFPLSLTGIPVHRKLPNESLNVNLPEEQPELENSEVSSQELSRNSRSTEDAPVPSSYASSGKSAAKAERKAQTSNDQSSKESVAPFVRVKKIKKTQLAAAGSMSGSQLSDHNPNPLPADSSPSQSPGEPEDNSRAETAPSAASNPISNANATTVPSASSSTLTGFQKPHVAHDSRGSVEGLLGSEGAIYRALYVVMALVLLVLLFFIIKFALYAHVL